MTTDKDTIVCGHPWSHTPSTTTAASGTPIRTTVHRMTLGIQTIFQSSWRATRYTRSRPTRIQTGRYIAAKGNTPSSRLPGQFALPQETV